MKTTIDLPDELVPEAKLRAVVQGRALKDLVADFIRQGLGHPARSEDPAARTSQLLVIAPDGLPQIRCRADALMRQPAAPAWRNCWRWSNVPWPKTICAMPGTLVDTNVWLASVFATHPGHAVARQALQAASPVEPALFCRATEQSLLRLLTTPALLRTYGAEGLSNRDALLTLKALQGLTAVRFSQEPPGTVARRHALAARDTTLSKLWKDAYLAGFALAGGLGSVTLDAAFRQFAALGLVASVLVVG